MLLAIFIVLVSVAFYNYALPIISSFLKANWWIPTILLILVIIGITLAIITRIQKVTILELLRGVFIHKAPLPPIINDKRIILHSLHISALLERATHRCQIPFCFVDTNPKIHHIDHTRNNPKSSNLIVLCPNHHDQADKNIWRKETLQEYNRKNNYYNKRGKKCFSWSKRQINDDEFKY
jgi:hypothetical protein